jgi:cysteinyl-tRNA synthetase
MIKVTNTLSGEKEGFVPQGKVVRMYVCGVTPYDDCHIGHALSYIVFDVIRRYLEFMGYEVKCVQNFTDIDDKIIDRANQMGISTTDLSERFIASYFADMDALNIKRAHIYPRATGEIDKIIEVVQGLIDKGYAYVAEGDVYFRVKSDPDYGKLSHQDLEALQSGARVEVGAGKEHALDFTLWKSAKPGEPWWDSPWGKGRPGWHIECSAMSLKYLGDTLDIHGGGQDLIFPHHENEMAQSECFTGRVPFVKYWLHNGLMQLGGEKMSKSLGVLVSIGKVLERFSPDALRLLILGSHYRSPVSFSWEGLEAAEKGVERICQAARGVSNTAELGVYNYDEIRQKFIDAMDDDFNTAQAIAILFDLAREINRLHSEGFNTEKLRQILLELAGVLGLKLEEREVDLAAAPFVDLLISLRNDLRAEKQWKLADKIRASLGDLGIALEDTPQGTVWKHKKCEGEIC